jgi:hypothetical protein
MKYIKVGCGYIRLGVANESNNKEILQIDIPYTGYVKLSFSLLGFKH